MALFTPKRKFCYSGCGNPRTSETCSRNSRYGDGLDLHCKECCAKRYQSERSKRRNQFLRKRYGITLDDFQAMVKQQNGVCAICGASNPGNTGCPKWERSAWQVDHNHQTKKVRGLLCHLCNRMLGMARENTTTLRNAAKYLEEKEKQNGK